MKSFHDKGAECVIEKVYFALRTDRYRGTARVNQFTEKFAGLLVRLINHKSLFAYFLNDSEEASVAQDNEVMSRIITLLSRTLQKIDQYELSSHKAKKFDPAFQHENI